MTRKQQHVGRHGEGVAAIALRRIGIKDVDEVGKLVVVRGNRIVAYRSKLKGDLEGIIPPHGRYVIAEVKTILDRNLRYSDLRKHQPERLKAHAANGGLSLLVWVHRTGVYVMEFPVSGFEQGKSLTVEQAQRLQIEAL